MKERSNQEHQLTGPFYNGKEAARYVGYSYDHFRHLASEYQIPRCGPRFNRYAQSTLDTWMSNPSCFKISVLPTRKKLKKLEVKA